MARTAITPVVPTRAGAVAAVPAAGDAVNGNSVANDGKTFLIATNSNGSATARTIDFVISRTVDGVTPDRDAISLDAGDSAAFGPFPTNDYGQTLAFDVSHAEMLVSAYRMP